MKCDTPHITLADVLPCLDELACRRLLALLLMSGTADAVNDASAGVAA